MGRVYLGRSTAGRLVAVKTIKIELADEAGFRARFAHEVAAARRVSGVFTAAVVAADPEADMPWLATAYVPAPSLSKLVAECGPLPVPTVRWLAAGCAEALASIHGAGLVHRDLKPSNVLVAPDGPRVIDFGVARAAERMGRTTARGAVGTPAYMAPEQARDTREASVASDVYSLGATLLFAATGHPPYDGTSASYTELPASYRPAPRRKPGHGHPRPGPGTGAAGGRQGSGWRRWMRAHMAWAGFASVGAALVVVGVILGSALSGSSSNSPATATNQPPVPPAAPKTVCGSSGQAGSGPAACMVKQS